MANSGHPIFQGADGRHYHGVRRVQKIASPAAGADLLLTVPGGVQWRLLLGSARLTAAAAVANRIASALITVEGVLVWQSVPFLTVTAGNVGNVFFQRNDGPLTANPGLPLVDVPIPSVWLPDGATFALSTAAIDVADQWSGINFWLEEQYVTDSGLEQRHIERDEERAAALAALTAAGVG